MLDNPRALAFSSAQDLYIIDSGNFKIRKLTMDGNFSTFVGYTHDSSVSSQKTDSWSGIGQVLLPGHWKQPNQYVDLQNLYFLNIDHEDNLWFVDSEANKIWSTPLASKQYAKLTGDAGIYLEQY